MISYENYNDEIIQNINDILNNKKDCIINIVNDKLTLSVFSLLEKNLKNVKEINLVIRDARYIPKGEEVSREFEIELKPKDMLFNEYDIVEKNKLQYFRKAKSMYEFIQKYVSVKRVKPNFQVRSNIIIIDEDFLQEDGKFYTIIKAIKNTGTKKLPQMDNVELKYGPVLLRKENPVFQEYLMEEQHKMQELQNRLSLQDTVSSKRRRKELEEELLLLARAMTWNHG